MDPTEAIKPKWLRGHVTISYFFLSLLLRHAVATTVERRNDYII